MATLGNRKKDKFARISSILFSLFIIALGLVFLFAGQIHYSNWWGGKVFAPLTVVVGTFMLYIVIYKWNDIITTQTRQNKKISAKKNSSGFYSLLVGMAIGFVCSALITYNLDSTKSWNPFGWWFPVTFVVTVICGFAGVIIYGYLSKKKNTKA